MLKIGRGYSSRAAGPSAVACAWLLSGCGPATPQPGSGVVNPARASGGATGSAGAPAPRATDGGSDTAAPIPQAARATGGAARAIDCPVAGSEGTGSGAAGGEDGAADGAA